MKEHRLWYRKPAEDWTQALPVGNGRLGAMIYGSALDAKLQLNEETIWSGWHINRINPEAREHLAAVRNLLHEGNIEEAENLAMLAMAGIPKSMRAYQTAGELHIHITGDYEITDYERELNLDTATVEVHFCASGVHYHQTCFASTPAGCIVVRIWNDEQIPFNLECSLHRGHDAEKVICPSEHAIQMLGNQDCGGIPFSTCVTAASSGETVKTLGETLLVTGSTETVLVLSIDTAYRNPAGYQEKVRNITEKAAEKPFAVLLQEHLEEYQPLFQRMQLEMTGEDRSRIPTDERLERMQAGADDSGMILLFFHYGRYLLIASSRPGSLPANLQGIWNKDFLPKWDSKFTININLQMNYWAADAENLSECTVPFFDFLERIRISGEETAWKMYGCRGSAAHHNTDLFADTAPQDHWRPGTIWVLGEAWLATHVWEHYLYTRDRKFLKDHFDILEECVLFFEDFLVEDENGCLIVTPSCSPENMYEFDGKRVSFCESSAMDVELLTELFEDYLSAARVLGFSSREQGKVQEMLAKMPALSVGKNGELLEWRKEVSEPEPGHRHLSHLYGVYPGHTLTREKTPGLFHAAERSLNRRLDHDGGSTGWSRAWVACLLADFGRKKDAYESLRLLISRYTQPNLLDVCPANGCRYFQIDGNFGACAALLEMLIQCTDQKLHLLPAVPKQFSCGTVRGLQTRLGVCLDMTWKQGKVSFCTLQSKETQNIVIVANGTRRSIHLEAGKIYNLSC